MTLALGVVACGGDSSGPGSGSDQLVVGALLALSGPGQTLGRTSEAALQLAADDLNAQLTSPGSAARVSVRVEDTGLDPSVALGQLKVLAADGVRLVIALTQNGTAGVAVYPGGL